MAPHGSGLDAQLGIGIESAWGTRQAPGTFLPFQNETLKLTPAYTESQPLMAGLMVTPDNLLKRTNRTVEGSISLELLDRAMGKIFDMLNGDANSPTTPDGATNSRLFTFEVGETSPRGKGRTIQVGRADTSGTVRPFDYIGCKFTEVVIAIEVGGNATLALTVDGKDEVTDQSLGSASYAAAEPFVFENWAVEVASSGVANVASLSISIPLGMKTDRQHLGSGGVKKEQLLNAPSDIRVTAGLEFASMDDHNRFKADASVELVASATGGEIEDGFDHEIDFSMPACRQVEHGPAVEGPDVITSEAVFRVLSNGTDPALTIAQQTSDTAL